MAIIKRIYAREILDSRGHPTIETEVTLTSGVKGVAGIPSGASTGSFEAVELRDNDKNRFAGKGVLKAIKNVNDIIAPRLVGENVAKQSIIDAIMIDIDNTDNKSKLGANAILSVSLACARAASNFYDLPLYKYVGGIANRKLPRPMMNILNGGVHADNKIDVQEFMIVPSQESSFQDYVLICTSIYHNLKKILKSKGLNSNVGDEGGVAPNLSSTTEALDLIMEAIKISGYKPVEDVSIALDVAASELYKSGTYTLEDTKRTPAEMIDFYNNLITQYPIISIEDPLHEEDWKSWTAMTSELGERVQIVGDDLYVTNISRLKKGIANKASNAILIKPNQIGTLTETINTVNYAKAHNYKTIISHRSGETNDTTISDLAVALGTPYIKTGAPSRGERVAKYNRLLKIEEDW